MSILDDILLIKKQEVNKLKLDFSLNSFNIREFFNTPVSSLRNSLIHSDRLGIIGEIKKASPSKGVLRNDFNHIKIAETYIANGIDIMSILTDKNFFQGDINFLEEISRFKTVPLLRKDFIIDEYQVYQAKAFGADAILLIAEILSKDQIGELTSAATEIGLEVLLELHSASQLTKIDFKKNNLIGINNRNLKTFAVDLGTTIELSEQIPDNVDLVSESGFNTYTDIKRIRNTNVKALLVGEHFMQAENIEKSIQEFKEWCRYES